ncbi:uncharacterized protein TNCV_1378661 [Trichonephila clavipes]|nr:uncharacterized protein TNCV_1378661 [Trichonephila clavipes]
MGGQNTGFPASHKTSAVLLPPSLIKRGKGFQKSAANPLLKTLLEGRKFRAVHFRSLSSRAEKSVLSSWRGLNNQSYLITAWSNDQSCLCMQCSNARELDERILEVKINPQEKNTVSDTSTNKDTLSKEKESENENEKTKWIRNDFEHYAGFIEAANQTAKSLESDVLNFLNILDINLVKCRGRGYDGATNISGMYGGLQKLIKDKPPRANYVHCSTHNLNLVLNDACYIVPHGATKIMIENWVASIESLRNTDLTSKALQSPKIHLENAKTILNSSLTSIENLRNNFANIKEETIGLAKK